MIVVNKEINDPNTEDGAILRTSTSRQQQDGDPIEIQRSKVEHAARKQGHSIGAFLTLSSPASGEFETQPLLAALETFRNMPNIKRVWFSVVNRGTRGEPLDYLQVRKKYSDLNIQLLDAEGKIKYEVINTLEAFGVKYKFSSYNSHINTEISAVIAARENWIDIQTQLHSAEIAYARSGYWVSGRIPDGYQAVRLQSEQGRRLFIEPHPIEQTWFRCIFDLSLKKVPKTAIIEAVNKLGYRSRTRQSRSNLSSPLQSKIGGKKLTIKQLDKFLRNPIYALIRDSKSQQTRGKAVRIKGTPYLTIEEFNKINEGRIRIIESEAGIEVIRGKTLERQIKNVKNDNYPFRRYILCPICKGALYGSASRSKSGRHIPRYHCSKSHKYWSVNQAKFEETVKKFTYSIKLSDEKIMQLKKHLLARVQNKLIAVQGTTMTLQERVTALEKESQLLLVKIEAAELLSVQKMLEEKLKKVEENKILAMMERDKSESEQIDIRAVIEKVLYFLEHLENGLLEIKDLTKRAAAWSTIFRFLPTYDELESGTPWLRHHIKLIADSKNEQDFNVGTKGLEPLTFSV